jgi:hypothetical protein
MKLLPGELARLKDFQQRTVRYVLQRYFGPNPTRRFLVADEVGMGKTMVACGVVAGTVDALRQPDSGIDRIDVLYVCSNAGIARQNLRKLDVLGEGVRPLSTRITLLATQVDDLNRPRDDGHKIVNLVALTPGTSFARGHASGRMEERALLYHFTRLLFEDGPPRAALARVLRYGVNRERWTAELRRLRQIDGSLDPHIRTRYQTLLQASPALPRLRELVSQATGRPDVPQDMRHERLAVVGELRHVLAQAGVDALEPDLIILDEFQRFRHLLHETEADEPSEFATLAHALFDYPDARLLLLSATPYKLYTLPEEQALDGGDDHYRDFLATIRFLARPDEDRVVDELSRALAAFRDRLVAGADPHAAKAQAEALLRAVMCRTERPDRADLPILHTRRGDIGMPTDAELKAFVNMRRLAQAVDGDATVEYWKSAPYFVNFMEGYQLAGRVRDAANDPHVQRLARAQPIIRHEQVSARQEIEPGNARLRALQEEIFDGGLHRLLWMPPSLAYHAPEGPYATADPARTTKRLIFSSWAAAPTSIAALLSHEALRRLAPDPHAGASPRLAYSLEEGRAERMTALMLTTPQPGLAALCDPLALAREDPQALRSAAEIWQAAAARVHPLPPTATSAPAPGASPERWYWLAPLLWPEGLASYARLEDGIHQVHAETRHAAGLRGHLHRADAALAGDHGAGHPPDDLARWVALTGLAAPANCAWRALRRTLPDGLAVADENLAEAAAMIGEGFRTLFNRAEVMQLLDDELGTEHPYWQQVLRYCLGGNLQAVLDEFFHHLMENTGVLDDAGVLEFAADVANRIAFGRGYVEGFDPEQPASPLRFNTRFALRYGSARGSVAATDEATARAADAQGAFNSPFWPFVLASTSVGQEGVDFHWWCHSLVHWNQPANVVDLEQREGRVHRYKGHAVRKNVAKDHREAALAGGHRDPWVTAFEAAESNRPPGMDELWPAWIYPGEARIDCWVPYSPLSRDVAKEQRLQRERVLYRLAFGQPRQEDLVQVLSQAEEGELADVRIDLTPQGQSVTDTDGAGGC